MNALPNLDAVQAIIDSAEAAGFTLCVGSDLLVRGGDVPVDHSRHAAEEQLAWVEEAMRKDPN